MAHEKQRWQDVLQTAISKGSGSNNPTDPAKEKARLMFFRRTLDKERKEFYKELKEYCDNHNPIKFNRLEEIAKKHGISDIEQLDTTFMGSGFSEDRLGECFVQI